MKLRFKLSKNEYVVDELRFDSETLAFNAFCPKQMDFAMNNFDLILDGEDDLYALREAVMKACERVKASPRHHKTRYT